MKTSSLVLLLTLSIASTGSAAPREEWYRGLDLEEAVGASDLILVAQVAKVSEVTITRGGKGESAMFQFAFKPLRSLKGLFARPELSLTSSDIGGWRFGEDVTRIREGEIRLLLLHRTGVGYENWNQSSSFDHALPPLADANDPLLVSVQTLIAARQNYDRFAKTKSFIDALAVAKGPACIPLLLALEKRALIAAQTDGCGPAIIAHLDDPSPAVREAAAGTLEKIFDADYLSQPALRAPAVTALAALLDKPDTTIAPRVAALAALGVSGSADAKQFRKISHGFSYAEIAAIFRAMGRLKMDDIKLGVADFLRGPPDASSEIEQAAGAALIGIAPAEARSELTARATKKIAAGLGIGTEISLAGEMPGDIAVPMLLDFFKFDLNRDERNEFAATCAKVAEHSHDNHLVAPLSTMLDPRDRARESAIAALIHIDSDDAAKALQPHLKEEENLWNKLHIAEVLGKHGIRDGYPYAIEHMSESYLTDQAVAALAAIREPKAVAELKKILETSNDENWNRAAIRALGALGEKEMAVKFLAFAKDFENPLAPSALIALGDLAETNALPLVRAGLNSRDHEIVRASARSATRIAKKLATLPDDIRDQLASLLSHSEQPDERECALDALLALNDPRLDKALITAEHSAHLEGGGTLNRVEKLLRERKVKLIP